MFGFFSRTATPDIRPLSADDSGACAGLHALSFAFPWPQTDIEVLLASPSTIGDGAFTAKSGEIEGFILARRAADEAEILTLAVHPRKRGQGLAGRLLRANIAALSAKGAKSLFLEVEAENTPALALYRRFAFETVGERKAYYRKADGGLALAFILRRSLSV